MKSGSPKKAPKVPSPKPLNGNYMKEANSPKSGGTSKPPKRKK